MKKKNILECSLVYGDCHAIPIDFVRTKKNLDIINSCKSDIVFL